MPKVRSRTAETQYLLTAIMIPLPFATWGMDILGPFPKATSQHKYLFGVMDYFTKWIKVEVITLIIAADIRKFIWKNIITPFDVP